MRCWPSCIRCIVRCAGSAHCRIAVDSSLARGEGASGMLSPKEAGEFLFQAAVPLLLLGPIGAMKALRKGGAASLPFSVHLWYADQPGTVVSVDEPGGIDDMVKRCPCAAARLFPGSAHSIHNTARSDFMSALKAVINEAAAGGAAPAGA